MMKTMIPTTKSPATKMNANSKYDILIYFLEDFEATK